MDPKQLKHIPIEQLTPRLKMLTYREREVLKLLAGINPEEFSYSREEVAHIFKVPPVQIDKLVKQSMIRLQKLLDIPVGVVQDPDTASQINISIALPEFVDEEVVVQKLVELFVSLDALHKAQGGMGLKVDDTQTETFTLVPEGAPC